MTAHANQQEIADDANPAQAKPDQASHRPAGSGSPGRRRYPHMAMGQTCDATSVLEDACADAVPTPFYDMVDEGFTPDDPFVKERHMITSADTGVFQQSSWNRRGQPSARAEVIYLIPTPEPQDEARTPAEPEPT